MRTINEVIIAVQEQQPCTDDELRLTLLAVSAMHQRAERYLYDLAEVILADELRRARFKAAFQIGEKERTFQARKTPADKYLGPEHTPGTPENKRLVQMGKNLLKKATGLDLDVPPTHEVS